MSGEKILIVGSGAREDAIGWKLRQSLNVDELYFAPGNAGTLKWGKNVDIAPDEIEQLARYAADSRISLTVVGPELPLSRGIVDLFAKSHLPIFGPTRQAAMMESSKAHAVEFMQRHGIPHPESFVFDHYENAREYLLTHDHNKLVIKADGLASGKGVVVPETQEEALQAIKNMMVHKVFGEAGGKIVVQEKLAGSELSVMALVDGRNSRLLLPVQDHKRAQDGDRGNMTGGMGAYARVPFVDSKLLEKVRKKIIEPTVGGLNEEKVDYVGVLYAGLMLTKEGPKVLEWNCRFGDPEVVVLMMMLKSDLLNILTNCLSGTLPKARIEYFPGDAATVVLAAAGYPGNYEMEKGKLIYGLESLGSKGVMAFHAGTKAGENGKATVNGGRVLDLAARRQNLSEALAAIHSSIGQAGVYFEKMQYRRDIGHQSLKRLL